MIITIDGPIATGKSSVAKHLATRLGYIFFDTGAMYRVVTFGVLKHRVNYSDPEELKKLLDNFVFNFKIQHGEKHYFVDNEDVTEKIRSNEVTANVSKIAALKAVRAKLMVLQREMAEGVNAIFEGRDMGSVVFPNADLKIFLSGRLEERAKRRFQELKEKFPDQAVNMTLEKLKEEIQARDYYDSHREIAPLVQAEDAYVIDTSDLSIEDVVDKIIEYKDSKPAST